MQNRNIAVLSVPALGLMFSNAANAAALSVTGATGALTDVSDTVPVIGAAFLAVLGLMAAWKLARGLFA
ncbi:MAG: major capsid protein [Magnetococcus sp. XQGC-1]